MDKKKRTEEQFPEELTEEATADLSAEKSAEKAKESKKGIFFRQYLKENGIRTKVRKKLSEGSEEILDSIKAGYVTYVINTSSEGHFSQDGKIIRRAAIDNNVAVFTCLDTVKIMLDVLEETTMRIATINEE